MPSAIGSSGFSARTPPIDRPTRYHFTRARGWSHGRLTRLRSLTRDALIPAAPRRRLTTRSNGRTVAIRAAFAANSGLAKGTLARALLVAVTFEAPELVATTLPAHARREDRKAVVIAVYAAAQDGGAKTAVGSGGSAVADRTGSARIGTAALRRQPRNAADQQHREASARLHRCRRMHRRTRGFKPTGSPRFSSKARASVAKYSE